MIYEKGKVRYGILNMRSQPSTTSTRVASIPDGTELVVNNNPPGDWCYTYYGMNQGYVDGYYVNRSGPAEYWEYMLGLKNLYKGCSNSLFVKNLQTELNRAGYPCGTADGIFGDNTDIAVRNFQRASGIRDDGIAGPQTKSLFYPEP